MKKTYWVKKDPNAKKEEIEWYEMSGIEFYKFITSPENKMRYFIDFDDMKIETDKTEYIQWRKEKNHRNYLQEQERQFITNSFDELYFKGDLNNQEILEPLFNCFEEEIERKLLCEKVQEAVLGLTTEEHWLIYELFLSEKNISESLLSLISGIPRTTLSYRKKAILKKLKKILNDY